MRGNDKTGSSGQDEAINAKVIQAMAKRLRRKKRPVAHAEAPQSREPSFPPMKITRGALLRALLIAAAVLWIFQPVFHGGWLWDDDTDIYDNTITRGDSGLWSIWFAPGTQIDYYPVKASVQWVQWHLFGMDTLGYHLTNIVLHFVGSLLVWRLLGKLGLRQAWIGGLIFAVHPVMIESVAWIAELKNTLSLPPFLLAMGAFVDYERNGRGRDYLQALAWFLVAMLCKTTMVMFPVVILLYFWWRRGCVSWKDLKVSVPFFAISLVLGLVTLFVGNWHAQIYHETDQGHSRDIALGGLFSRLGCAGAALAVYTWHFIWPVQLLPIYSLWQVDPPEPWQFVPLFVLAGLVGWFWTERKSWGRHLILGVGFYMLNLVPFVGFIPISYMRFSWVMDHFLYIPSIGLIGLLVAGWGQLQVQLREAWPRSLASGVVAPVRGASGR